MLPDAERIAAISVVDSGAAVEWQARDDNLFVDPCLLFLLNRFETGTQV